MNSNKCFVTVVVVIGLVLGLFSVTTIANQLTFQGKPVIDGVWRGESAQWIGGEILVLFQTQDVPADNIASTVGGRIIRGVEPDGFAIIEVPVDSDIPALCEKLYGDPRVRVVGPNMYLTIGEWNPNDPYYTNGTQYSLRNTGQNPPNGVPDADIDANYAWDYTRGSGSVILAILDSGIDMDTATMTLRHSDLNLAGKIIQGPDYIGDGYGVADLNSHGTHVAGIASAETNNSTGIAGVAEDCDILVIQVFNAAGSGTEAAVRDGINYAVAYENSHPGTRVIMNYSGGGGGAWSVGFVALQNAQTNGVPFVTISHNDYSSTCRYPCQYSSDLNNLICVGATESNDQLSDYSNYCVDVDVCAPGGFGDPVNENKIWSCVPANTYGYKSGTSMAAPHVTGICGLVVAYNMSITAANLKTLIRNTAEDEVGLLAEDPEGYDNRHGYGRANAWGAIVHSPALVTPYLQQDQRCSNVLTAGGQYKSYRLAPPTAGTWEVAAVRPTTGIDADIQWLDASAVMWASSGYGGQTVDFVLANQRSTSGLDHYAKVLDYSGSGKYCVEYQRATESYIGSMYKSAFQWKSAHVVEIWELYLQNGHRYTFKADVISGEVDVGISLVGRTGSGAYYTQRGSAVFNIDSYGSGGDEATSQDISADGWYAFVVWSNNGRNGVMDVYCEERLYGNTSVVLSEQSGVDVSDGYYYEQLFAGSTMGVMGVRPVAGFDYDMYLYSTENYSGSALAGSAYGGEWVDFVLFDKATFTAGWYYPKVEYYSGSGTSGNTVQTEDTDEFLSSGTNGPFTFSTTSVARAWDVNLTSGTEYQFVGDITSGSLNLGIALYRQDATFKSAPQYIQRSYAGGNGVDETMSWVCDATGYYTLVAWTQNGLAGTYYINLTSLPNLDAYVATGWSYEFVPRNTGGASYGNCPITATLPGNSTTTYLNWIVRNTTANAIPSSPTFYTYLNLDGSFFYSRPWTSGLAGNGELHFTNWTTTTPIQGGKHTIELREDGSNVITESNESDNSYIRQFVWSPYVLTKDVPVDRTPAPPISYIFPRPNSDGFQFTTTPSYAYAVGICPRGSTDNYDLEGCDDYVGSLSGFDSVRVSSIYSGWYTDYVVATWTGVASTMYPDVYAYSGGSGNYVIEATDTYGRVLGATDEVRHDSLATDHIIRTYEVYLRQDSTYRIILDNLSGTANLDLSLYGPTYGYYSKGSYAAASWTASSDEMITYTATATAYYVITVHKTAYAALPATNVYDLTTELIPPNIVTTVPTGWSYGFVPRDTTGAGTGSCLITATLPGNSVGTYLNFCEKNDGVRSVPAVTFYNQLYLDGSSSVFFERPWSTGITPGGTRYHINWTSANPIRGGRHTVELRLDGTNTIYETNEGDNSVERQFVWSPYVLSNGVAVTRSTPPPYDVTFPHPNCDGFQYTRNSGYAYGIAVCPTASEDHDLFVYTDYTGSESGFSALARGSYWTSNYTDFVIATYTGTASTVYPGLTDYLGTGTHNSVIEAIDSYGKILAPTDLVVNDTLLSNEILNVYEVYMDSGTTYTISTTTLSGTADITLSLFGPNSGYYSRGDQIAISQIYGSSNETITYASTTTAWYVVVVFKQAFDQLANSIVYRVSAIVTPSNLTYATPTGWTYPIVPRNAGGATPGSCTLTATLPGNTANTNYNISSYNQGPNPTTKTYYDYVYIDSVSYYGAVQTPPIASGAFGLRQNLVSANVVRGGRHTMGVWIDRNDSIPESNETDNWYSRQFVWSPYILTNNTPVSRGPAPAYGFETYPNCDGFEFTSGWWGSVGTIPYSATDDYNLRLHNQWTNSQTGFGATLAGSGWGVGLNDFVIMNRIYGGPSVYDVGVVKDLSSPGLNYFTVQQANEQITYYTPGTYGPFSLPSNQVMSLWEVYLSTPGIYNFQVDVTSGTANIGTSLYDGSTQYNSKSGYFTGGYSNSAGGGGDESFSITNPYYGMYFGWVVWKVGSPDRTLTSTFNLIWSSSARIPKSVDDLMIERVDSTGAKLSWSPVTMDTTGLPIAINYYRIHRNLNPGFTPSHSDSIGYTVSTTEYTDAGVVWSNQKYFYKVIAVDTDGTMLDQPNGSDTGRIVVGCPPRADAPEAIRSRYRQ